MEKKMPFSKFECKDVGIPTYKRDKRENDDDHKPLVLKSPFVEVEIEGKESIFIQKRTAVWLFKETERISADCLLRVHVKQPFSEKKGHRNVLDKEIPIVTELDDLCAFVVSAGRFRNGRLMQFVKYYKSKKKLQYKGNYANIVGKFGVFVHGMKNLMISLFTKYLILLVWTINN